MIPEVVKNIRKEFGETDQRRDWGCVIPAGIRRLVDISYGHDQEQLFDIYLPENVEGSFPLIINVHGGGWVYGSKETYQFYCYEMCVRGFAVINFNYHLAPEYDISYMLDDINLMVKWVMKNYALYNLDARHIFMMGDSAGAHLLGVYHNIIHNNHYAQLLDIKPPKEFKIKAIALCCGVYDLSLDISVKELIQYVINSKDIEQYNVLEHMNEDASPMYIMTSVRDIFREQTSLLEQQLLKRNIPFVHYFYSDDKKSLKHCFHLDVRNPYSRKMYEDLTHYFQSFIPRNSWE